MDTTTYKQMTFKIGRGTNSNTSNWYCAYNADTNEYTAVLEFSGYAGFFTSMWIINKEIWDKVGTFEDDDCKSERLIRTGKRAFESERGVKWWPYMPDQVYIEDYKNIFEWYYDDLYYEGD